MQLSKVGVFNESLESRRLLSAAALVDGILTVSGTSDAERFFVFVSMGPDEDGYFTNDPSRLVLGVGVRNQQTNDLFVVRERFAGEFSQIRINGNGGDDTVTVDSDASDRGASVSRTNDQASSNPSAVRTNEGGILVIDPRRPGKFITQAQRFERYIEPALNS